MEESKSSFNYNSSLRIKILIILSAIILVVLMFPRGLSLDSEVTVGTIWLDDDLIAEMNFALLKDPAVYEREKREAAADIYMVFVKDDYTKFLDTLQSESQKLKLILDENIKVPEAINSKKPEYLSEKTFNLLCDIKLKENLLSVNSPISIREFFQISERLLTKIYRQGLIDLPFEDILSDTISVREGKFLSYHPKLSFFDRNTLGVFIENSLSQSLPNNLEFKNSIIDYLSNFVKPNINYSENYTNLAREDAKTKVLKNIGIINENERIIAKHDRITDEAKNKIDSYRMQQNEKIGFWAGFGQNFGKFIHILILLSIFSIYIILFRKKIYNSNASILLIAIIILLVSFNSFIVQQLNVSLPAELLILVPVASMLLTIMFDSRIGFYGTIVIALICGALRGNDYIFAVMNIIAGAFAAYTVRDIKNRNQIFRSFIFIFLGYFLSIVAFGLESFKSVNSMLVSIGFAASNAIVSPALTFGLIVFFEKIFKITTDLTYFELTDFNHPLLKQLARNAPGTFTHSMTIGSIVEATAGLIGANPILARVGAYYHDVGKILDPSSFVENQMSNENVHEKLDVIRSAELIVNHVNQGIEFAKRNKLPQEIIDFIPTHHGTMAVQYFYEKAKEEFGEENVNIDDFRYPGPLPTTKETALVMLTDCCESAVRSMKEADPQKVENVINNLVNQRVSEGQLDNSPLTFNDIKIIKESLLSNLLGQYHKRIRYPNQDKIESEGEKKGVDERIS